MIVYISISITILIAALILRPNILHLKRVSNNEIFLFLIGIVLLFFSGFRGNISADYNGYIRLFNYYNLFRIDEIFINNFHQEIGFVLLNRIIGIFTSNEVYLMLITSFIVIKLTFSEVKKYSTIVWLSVFMFVTIGSYYTSFNLIRQIIAASIVFSGSKYLYERNFIKYLKYVFIAVTFHKTAIIMIFFYIISNKRINYKYLIVIGTGMVITTVFLEDIIRIVQMYVYSHYYENSFGMIGFNFKNLILPISIGIFVLLHYKILDSNNTRNRIWVNASLFYVFFSFLGYKIQMIQRLSEFFSPYLLLLVPYIISSIKDKHLRIIYIFVFIILLIAYNYFALNGTMYDPYHFIWKVE